MDKRYQVFISSTFEDLREARQEVSQALLEADCFPAGMELFPAADEEQFEYIKQVIDESDYYVLITAGRYGSIHPETGLSYTEMEYDYAVETEKPVIRLLHKDPFNTLTGDRIEQSDDAQNKLRAFRKKVANERLVRYWKEPAQLGHHVSQSLRHCIKVKPAKGWVRADAMAAPDAEKTIAELRLKISELERRAEAASTGFSPEIAINNIPVNVSGRALGFRAEFNIELRSICLAILNECLHSDEYLKIEESVKFDMPEEVESAHAGMQRRVFSTAVDALEAFGFIETSPEPKRNINIGSIDSAAETALSTLARYTRSPRRRIILNSAVGPWLARRRVARLVSPPD